MSEIRLDANAQAAVAEILKVVDAALKVEASGEKLIKKSKEQADEERRLARIRKQLLEESLTGVERAQRKIEDFEKSIQGQAVEEQKLGRIRQQLAAELKAALDAQSGETARLAEAEADRARKAAELAAQEKQHAAARTKYFNEYQSQSDRAKAKIAEFERAIEGVEGDEKRIAATRKKLHAEYAQAIEDESVHLKQAALQYEEIDKESGEAFDVSRLTSYAAGFLSVTGAAAAVLATIRGIREEADRSGDKLSEISGSSGNLAQLAAGDSAKLDKLYKASDEIFAEGLVRSREEADRLVFELESAGRLSELAFFKKVSAIDDAASLAKSVGTVSAGFIGGDAVGSSEQIISKAIAAANPAVGADAKDIAQAVADVAGLAKQFQIRDEEVFAAISVIAQQTGSAAEAATNFRQLLVSSTRRGLSDELRGQGVSAILNRVSKEGSTDEELLAFLGDTQGLLGFQQLAKAGSLLAERTREVEQAAASGLSTQTIDVALGSTRVAAARELRRGEAQDQISRTDQAAANLQARGEIAQAEAAARRQGASEVNIAVNRKLAEVERFALGDGAFDQTAIDLRRKREAVVGEGAGQLSDLELAERFLNIQAQGGGKVASADEAQLAQAEQQAAAAREQAAAASRAYSEGLRAKEAAEEAAKEADKQTKLDGVAQRKEEVERRRELAAVARAENEATRTEREASAFAIQARETAEIAKRAGVGFQPEAAIDAFRAQRPDEAAGRTDTEILREIAKDMKETARESKKQTDLLKKRTGTKVR